MVDIPLSLVVLFVVVLALVLRTRWLHPVARLRLPPGPPGYPFIGNILDVPNGDMAPAFRDLNKKYGTHDYCGLSYATYP